MTNVIPFRAPPLFDPWESTPVPAFPLDALPDVIADFASTQGEAMGGDPAAIAMAALVACGTALDHSFSLSLTRFGNWRSSPRLWVALIGDPSRKKTPAINAALNPLQRVEHAKQADWKRSVKAHLDAGGKEQEAPEKPPRYTTNSTTIEKLGDILSRQSRGILQHADELAGWISSMEKYSSKGGGADRAFWLRAFDGGPFSVDRLNRGETLIENLSVSVVGGIQPARLREMRDQTSDGLLQRFIPVMLRDSRFPKDQRCETDKYDDLIQRLLKLAPTRVRFGTDGQDSWDALHRYIHDIERVSGGLAQGFQGFAGKLATMAGSLALIIHLAADPEDGPFNDISAATVRKVDRIVRDFIVPHATEFYRLAETTTDGDRLQRIASFVLTCGSERLRPSDFASNVAACRGMSPRQVHEAVAPLVATEWLHPIGDDIMPKAWKVAPQVAEQFSERRSTEVRNRRRAA